MNQPMPASPSGATRSSSNCTLSELARLAVLLKHEAAHRVNPGLCDP
jgi:hypothetical protein